MVAKQRSETGKQTLAQEVAGEINSMPEFRKSNRADIAGVVNWVADKMEQGQGRDYFERKVKVGEAAHWTEGEMRAPGWRWSAST